MSAYLVENMAALFDIGPKGERFPVVYISAAIARRAKAAGIDVDEFYMREYGAKVEVLAAMPTDG